jgi:zinc transporter
VEENRGFVYCATLDGTGSARELVEDRAEAWQTSEDTVWFHLDFSEDSARAWLDTQSKLSELTIEMLVSEDTRPRITGADGGLVICLRAVNCNPGSDPDDMVSLRLWIGRNRVLSMRRRPVAAIDDIRSAILRGDGPTESGDFLVFLCDKLTHRIAEVAGDIDEGVDSLEDEILEKERATLRAQILKYRRMIIGLRKYLIPQRELLSRLQTEHAPWLSEMDRLRVRESAERNNRCVDDLDAARDRASMAQEELNAGLSEQMNRTIFILSIVATIFLPLGLITGLLGSRDDPVRTAHSGGWRRRDAIDQAPPGQGKVTDAAALRQQTCRHR